MTEESLNSNADTLDRYRRRQSAVLSVVARAAAFDSQRSEAQVTALWRPKAGSAEQQVRYQLGSSNVDTEPFPGVDGGRWKSADRACIEPSNVRSFYRFSMRADADSIALLSAWLYRVAS